MASAIPLNLATQLQSYACASMSLDQVDILTANLLEAPANFLERARPVQINGQLLELTPDAKLSLRTAAGEVSLQLNQATEEQLFSLKNLLAAPQSNRSLATLLIQPDAPHKATLILPKSEQLNILRTPFEGAGLSGRDSALQNFSKGETLTLTVLPDKIEESILASPKDAPLLSKSSEQAVEKAFDTLHKTVETALQKGIENKPVTKETLSPDLAVKTAPTSPAQTESTAPNLTQGQELHAKIDRLITHLKEEASALAPNQIKATVVGKSHSNHVILNSGSQTLFVKQEGHLPTGTEMVLTLSPEEPIQEAKISLPTNQESPALKELITALQQSNPSLAEQILQIKIPSPAQNMTGTTLFFMAALQAEKLNEWLGLPVHMSLMKENKKELIDKLILEMTEGSHTATDARAGEWKAYPLPIHHDAAFDMLRLYVRNEMHNSQNRNGGREQKKHTHFIISMNMSRLGPVQMEGFSRSKRLDLVIRSERPLPKELPRTIREGYTNSMDALGMSGTLVFQTGHEDWVRISEGKEKTFRV